MEFYNAAVDTGLLPKADTIALQPVEADYLTVLRWSWRISTVIFLAGVAAAWYFIPFFKTQLYAILIGSGWFMISIIRWVWVEQSFKRKAYALREHDIIYRSGWLIQETQVCPFNRIQHCSINSGPIERRYKLASLSLYTAGTEEADFTIHGLSETNAASMRDFILTQINSTSE